MGNTLPPGRITPPMRRHSGGSATWLGRHDLDDVGAGDVLSAGKRCCVRVAAHTLATGERRDRVGVGHRFRWCRRRCQAHTQRGHRQGAHSGDAACACRAIDAEALGGATNPKAPVSAIDPEAEARVLSIPMLAMHLRRECPNNSDSSSFSDRHKSERETRSARVERTRLFFSPQPLSVKLQKWLTIVTRGTRPPPFPRPVT